MIPSINRHSIRFRLTLWYSVVLLAGVILIESFVWLAMRRELMTGFDSALLTRSSGTLDYLRIEQSENASSLPQELKEIAGTFPPDYVIEVLTPDRTPLFATPGAIALLGTVPRPERNTRIMRTVHRNGSAYRLVQQSAEAGGHQYLINIAARLDQTEGILRTLGLLMLAALPVVVVFAAAGGYWLSSRALSPVDSITRAARSIGIENLSARLPQPRTNDEIARLAATWNEMLARLEAAVQRITEFTSDASHELRTPIAFIRSTAEIAQRRPRSERDYRAALQDIELESERMTRLVEDLLFLARADAADRARHLQTLDLRTAVTAACAEIAPLAAAKRVSVAIDCANEVLTVAGDRSALRRMVLALLDNAVKYTPEGGSVSVSTSHSNGHASILVHDNGTGISPGALPHIFERFYRADPSRSRESGGHGLGLSLAQTIAHQHFGEIVADSHQGQGSLFRISLPLVH